MTRRIIDRSQSGLPWGCAAAGGTGFEGGAVHSPEIHIHIFTINLVFSRDDHTKVNYATRSTRQAQSFRRNERGNSGQKRFCCLEKLALGQAETDLGKWEGAEPLSQGTSMSKGPEASRRGAVRKTGTQIQTGDSHAQGHTGCQVSVYLLSEYARSVENTRNVSTCFV